MRGQPLSCGTQLIPKMYEKVLWEAEHLGRFSVVSPVPIIQTLRLHHCWHCSWPHLHCGYTGKGPCCILDIVSPSHQQKFTKVRSQDCNNGPGPAVSAMRTVKTIAWVTTHKTVPIKFQFSSVTESSQTLYDPMDCSTSSFPVHHQILELIQTHVHRVGDAF